MSKSRGNVVNPDEYIEKFGADTLRMYLMFLAPFEQGGDFRDAGILGLARFLDRVWKLFLEGETEIEERGIKKAVHKTIKKVTEDIESLHYNTAISALMILLNEMEGKGLSRKAKEVFLKLLAPFAPHIAEELWHELDNPDASKGWDSDRKRRSKTSIHKEPWPQYDPKLVEDETFTLVIQVNGKLRDQVEAQKNISQKEAEALAMSSGKVKNFLKNQEVKKVIFVPNRLINLVL